MQEVTRYVGCLKRLYLSTNKFRRNVVSKEIQEYAKAVEHFVEKYFPVSYEALKEEMEKKHQIEEMLKKGEIKLGN